MRGSPCGEHSRVRGRFFYCLRMNRGFSQGEFGKAVLDSGRDRAEGTGCVGSLLTDVLELLYLFPEHTKLQVPFRGPGHFHVQE